MKNLKHGKVPILAFIVIVFLVGFFVLAFLLYDFAIFLYDEAQILIDTLWRVK